MSCCGSPQHRGHPWVIKAMVAMAAITAVEGSGTVDMAISSFSRPSRS
jgi:hypothetical protein